MRFLKCFLLVLFLSEIIICAKAQDKPLTIYDRIIVEKDSIAQVGKLYRLTFKYTTKDPRERLYYLKWDNDGGDFDIITGPSHSFISSKQNVDGSLIDTYTDSYTYSILFNKEGVFAIPPMSAKNRRGNSIASDSIIVVVKKRQEKNLEANVHSPNDILDVEVSVNKTQIELGDSIECEIRFYTNLNLNQYKIHTNLLADNSFWKVHDVSETEWKIKEEYKAQKVQTLLASKYTLHPLQAGKIYIRPMEYTFTQVIRDESIDPFEAFFQGGSGYYEVDTLVKSNHVEIKIDQKETKSNSMEFQEEPTDINYAIVIDRSSSLMAKTDSLSPSFMNLENEFFNQMKKDEVQKILNITCFASKPHFFRLSEINNLETIIPSEGKDGSAIYDAILATVIRGGPLQSGNYPFSILLLTDGADNSSRLSKSTLTNILLQNKIRVDVVAFVSTKDSVYYNFEVPSGGAMIKNEQNFTDVEEIAKATNGLFVLVENKKQISSAIRKIKKQMQKVNSSMRKPEDDFHPDENMLITLYNSILLDAESEF